MSSSRLSICEVSTPDTGFLDDLAIYAAEGIEAISIAQRKLDQLASDKQVKALQDSGLASSAALLTHFGVLSTGPAFPGPDDVDARIELISDCIRSIAPFRPSSAVVVTGARGDRSAADAKAIAVEGLRELCRVAREVDVVLSLEILRSGHDIDVSIIHDLPQAFDLLDEIGAPDLTICYDVYHLWDTSDIVADTRAAASRVGSVQISDWREPARGPRDRLMPGDGVIDLPPLIEALEEGGYSGWYDLEVFSDDGRFGYAYPDSIWKLSTTEIVRRARASFETVWPG